MKRALSSCLLNFWLLAAASASVPGDSAVHRQFSAIAGKLKLSEPKLKKEGYEVRIWQKQALRYGDAQMVYILKKTARRLQIVKYLTESDKQGFRYATILNPTPPLDPKLWDRLVEQDILALPETKAVYDRLFPKSVKDSTWYVVESDGSISVKARKQPGRAPVFSDGEPYYFEVFKASEYQARVYGNPREYARYIPKTTELQKIVAILDELAVAFQSVKRL